MRRLLFTIMASCALVAVALPASAAASRDSHAPRDHHHHAIRHGRIRHERTAGTITAVGPHSMTLTLPDQSTVTGAITRATQIRCEAPDQEQMQTEDRGSGGGDNGSGDNGSGDHRDNRDHGDNDAADDNDRNDADAGDDQGEHEAQGCSLAVGMTVHRAELDISHARSVWREIEVSS